MPQVQLDDRVFKVARRRAAEAGYSSVEQYIADVVVQDADDKADDFDRLFTPEVVARLDQISDEMRAGKSVCEQEVDNHLGDVRDMWPKVHASESIHVAALTGVPEFTDDRTRWPRKARSPVGLILCDRKDDAVAHYSLDGLPSKVLAARYKTALPDEKLLADEVRKTRERLKARSLKQRYDPVMVKFDQKTENRAASSFPAFRPLRETAVCACEEGREKNVHRDAQ